jgi:hypothetical protein
VKTSSFRLYRGPGRVNIARGARHVIPGFRIYRALQPGPWFNSVDDDEYCQRYAAILAALDPERVWHELHALAMPAEPILCCWEVPPFTAQNWCHRRLVATWFNQTLGYDVPEWRGCHRARLRGAISPLFFPAI